MDPAVFGYIRVSQAEGASGLDTQRRIFTDFASGRNMRRPAGRPPGTRGCHDDPSRGPRPVRRRRQRHGSGCGQRHVAQHPSVLQAALEQVAGLDEGPGFAGTASTPPGPGLLPRRPGRSRGQPVGRQAGDALGPTGPWRTSCARRPTWRTLPWSIRQPGNDESPRALRGSGTWDKASLNPNATSTFPSSPQNLRIPKNNLIVDPRLTTVQQLNDPAPAPPSRRPSVSFSGFGVRLDVPQTIHIRRSSRNSEAGFAPVTSR